MIKLEFQIKKIFLVICFGFVITALSACEEGIDASTVADTVIIETPVILDETSDTNSKTDVGSAADTDETPAIENENVATTSQLTTNFVDVHMHLNGYGQDINQTDVSGSKKGKNQGGAPDSANYEAAALGLIQKMDKLGVAMAVVMPPPQPPDPNGAMKTYEAMLPTIKNHPNRLFFMAGGGELNPLIVDTPANAVTASMEAEFKSIAEQILKDGAKGFGEMAALHFCFSETHHFEQTIPDHPLFLLLADIAAQHGVPIDLHMEIVPQEQSLPSGLNGICTDNPFWVAENIDGFERLLKHNRDARIVLQHVGWDNTGYKTVTYLRLMLTKHVNLFMALKFVDPELEPFNEGNEMFDADRILRPEWLQLFTDFPDRFVIGADEFVGASDQVKSSGPPSFTDTWSVMEQLPQDLRAKIGSENAIRIYRLLSTTTPGL